MCRSRSTRPITRPRAVKFVRAGAYTMSETVPAGWDLTGVVCTGDGELERRERRGGVGVGAG